MTQCKDYYYLYNQLSIIFNSSIEAWRDDIMQTEKEGRATLTEIIDTWQLIVDEKIHELMLKTNGFRHDVSKVE